MKKFGISVMVLALLSLSGCGEKEATTNTASKEVESGGCNLVSTKDDSPLLIKAIETDTPQAKEFLKTCVNPYTKIYAADEALAKKEGRRVFTYNNCAGCHGGKLEGVMAPSLRKDGGQGAFDTKWVYAINSTDKGMFETIAGGTPGKSGGNMFVWHNQLEGHTGDGLSTDEILKVIAYIRTEYKGDGEKNWMQ